MHCTKNTYKGDYVFTVTGSTPDAQSQPSVPFAVVGRFTADGQGHITGKQTRNVNGHVVRETYTETYTVHRDCTGSSHKVTSGGGDVHFDFVLINEGKTVVGVETDPGNVLTFRAERSV
jgi:hypothetical protein